MTAPDPLPDSEAVLQTLRLQLEPLRAAHAAELYPLLADPRLYPFVPQDPPAHLDALLARYRRLERRASDDGRQIWLNWALRAPGLSGAPLIGTVQATVLTEPRAFIAYELGLPFQQRGFAAEACQRVLDLLFDDYRVDLVDAHVDTLNAASIKLLQRLGFEQAGFTPEADAFKGRRSDEYRYRLDARTWSVRRLDAGAGRAMRPAR